MKERAYPTKIQEDIEKTITNSVSFKDSPRDLSVDPVKGYALESSNIHTLVGLREYLCTLEVHVVCRGEGNYPKSLEARHYLYAISDMAQWKVYHERFDLNTPKGIDGALKDRTKAVSNHLRNTILKAS